jgi:KTSC domain
MFQYIPFNLIKENKEESKMQEILIQEFTEEDSSLIRGVGYGCFSREDNKGILRIRFATNPNYYYDYIGVTPERYAGLLVANSMGSYYNRYILKNPNYYCTKTPIPTQDNKLMSNEDIIDQVAERVVDKVYDHLTGLAQDFLSFLTGK